MDCITREKVEGPQSTVPSLSGGPKGWAVHTCECFFPKSAERLHKHNCKIWKQTVERVVELFFLSKKAISQTSAHYLCRKPRLESLHLLNAERDIISQHGSCTKIYAETLKITRKSISVSHPGPRKAQLLFLRHLSRHWQGGEKHPE